MSREIASLLLASLLLFSFTYSQRTRNYSPDRKTRVSAQESLFSSEIKKIEQAGVVDQPGVNKLLATGVFTVELLDAETGNNVLTDIRQATTGIRASSTWLRDRNEIDGDSWERSVKYSKKGTFQLSFDKARRNYDLVEVIAVSTMIQPDTSQNFINTEKIFYWISRDDSYDFAIVYKQYRTGRLTQEIKQVYAGKSQLAVFDNIVKTKSNEPVTDNNSPNYLRIYPNPTSRSQLSISFNTIKPATPVIINLYDVSGKLLKSFKRISGGQSTTISLDIGQHTAGVYTLQVLHDNINSVQRLVITQ